MATWILRDGQESRQTPIRYHSCKELCTQQMQLMFSTALNAALASTFGRYEKDIHRTLTKGVRDRKSTTFLPRLRGDCGSYRCPALFLDDGSGRSRLCCWADKCAEKLKRHFGGKHRFSKVVESCVSTSPPLLCLARSSVFGLQPVHSIRCELCSWITRR